MGSRALILAPFSREALDILGASLPVIYESWMDTRRLYAPDELSERIVREDVGMLVVEADFVFEEVFQEAGPLRFLGVCRNSVDHVDLESATRHGVAVVNTPGRNAQAVAELTMGLILSLARRIPQMDNYVKTGAWDNPVEPYVSMRGMELSGKTLGLIGLGAVGGSVSRLAGAFGMGVVAYDPYVGPREGAALAALDEVLSASDVVSVHTSGSSPNGKPLLDEERLSKMKPGAYLVNTASHSAVDEAALVEGLRTGHIAGAALDVHRAHPIPPDSPLLGISNVLLTPHTGGATDGTVERHSSMMVDEIQRYLQGKRPIHLVNGDVWNGHG